MATELATEVLSSNGLKRKQSPTPEPDEDHKRARTVEPSGNSAPDMTDSVLDEEIKLASPCAVSTHNSPNSIAQPAHPEPRRRSTAIDEKGKAKRLFGGLLGPVVQPAGVDRTSKRRQEIESRKKAELERLDEQRAEDAARKAEELKMKRSEVRRELEEEERRERSTMGIYVAEFLRTEALPKLYYRPWELRPDEEDRIAVQIRAAKGEPDPADEPDKAQVDGDEKRDEDGEALKKMDILPTMDGSTVGTNGEVISLGDRVPAVERDGSNNEPEQEGAVQLHAVSSGKDVKTASASTADKPADDEDETRLAATNGTAAQATDAHVDTAEAAAEKEAVDADDEHMVEGDEDTVIY